MCQSFFSIYLWFYLTFIIHLLDIYVTFIWHVLDIYFTFTLHLLYICLTFIWHVFDIYLTLNLTFILHFFYICFTFILQVLEVLIETCHWIINSNVDDVEYWLQSVEKVAKATILGHLLPVLHTALTHRNSQLLPLAEALMSQVVRLVVLTSQVCAIIEN